MEIHQDYRYSIIITNYNGLKYMEKCMAALRKQSYTSFIVINVDNGSTDGSREYLEELAAGEKHLKIKNIFLNENTGFSGAVNVGISAAETEFVVLLNNDTEPERDYLKRMDEVFAEDKEKKIFAVTPKMLQLYAPQLLDDAGDGYNLLGWAFQRGVGQREDSERFNRKTNVFSACAGAAAYRKELLDEICFEDDGEEEMLSCREGSDFGELRLMSRSPRTLAQEALCPGELRVRSYFDPLHFAYLEDVDVSFRARVRGYEIVYLPESRVLHVGSGTSGSRYNHFKVRLAARNNVYLNYKNMPWLMLIVNFPFIMCGVIVKQIFFMRRGFGGDYAAGFAEGIRTIGKCRARKTCFRAGRLKNYLRIEGMLIADTVSYIQDVLVRHTAKRS